MKILACDTSNRVCSVCLWEDGRAIDTRFRNDGLTHSQTFMPQMHDLMESNRRKYEDLDVLACTVGPGSFTGIRIGVAAVKTMALVLDKPALPVSSLASMAWPLKGEDALVVALIDCRNHRAFAGAFYHGEPVLEECAEDVNDIRKACLTWRDENQPGKKILLVGTGAKLFLEQEAGITPEDLVEYREGFDEILPESVAAVAEKMALAEKPAGSEEAERETTEALRKKYPAVALMPVYLGKTQAERNANAQGKDLKEIPIRYYSTDEKVAGMALKLNRAKKEDLEEVHEIEIASFPDPWSVDSLWAFASDESVRTLVCAREEATGELVGYYALQYVLDEAEIAIIAVKRKFRRQGLGRYLLEQIVAWAGTKDIAKIHLEVRSENEAAVHLYRSFGFEEVGRRKNYYTDPSDDAILFCLSI